MNVGKAIIPVTRRVGPYGCETFSVESAHNGGVVVNFKRRPPFTFREYS
jgi:hypothetical protein